MSLGCLYLFGYKSKVLRYSDGLQAGLSGVRTPAGERYFLFLSSPKPSLPVLDAHRLLFSGLQGSFLGDRAAGT